MSPLLGCKSTGGKQLTTTAAHMSTSATGGMRYQSPTAGSAPSQSTMGSYTHRVPIILILRCLCILHCADRVLRNQQLFLTSTSETTPLKTKQHPPLALIRCCMSGFEAAKAIKCNSSFPYTLVFHRLNGHNMV